MTIQLVYGDSGDWVGLYKDGKLVAQKHSFQEDDLLRHLDIYYEAIYDVPTYGTAGLPHTYEEALNRLEEKKQRVMKAAELREQAAALIEQAKQLEGGKGDKDG